MHLFLCAVPPNVILHPQTSSYTPNRHPDLVSGPHSSHSYEQTLSSLIAPQGDVRRRNVFLHPTTSSCTPKRHPELVSGSNLFHHLLPENLGKLLPQLSATKVFPDNPSFRVKQN
jgi:hypothetical protein